MCSCVYFRSTPHPVITTISVYGDYMRVLSFACYATSTGWRVHLTCRFGVLEEGFGGFWA